jgi:chromosome segregation protein
MEESGISKIISARLDHSDRRSADLSSADDDLPGVMQSDLFEDEEVEAEEGRELPPGIDDPSKVSEEDLRPIRSKKRRK